MDAQKATSFYIQHASFRVKAMKKQEGPIELIGMLKKYRLMNMRQLHILFNWAKTWHQIVCWLLCFTCFDKKNRDCNEWLIIKFPDRMALPFVFLLKNLHYKVTKSPSVYRCLTKWLDYSGNNDTLVVISVSLTEVKWAESLRRTLKEACCCTVCLFRILVHYLTVITRAKDLLL